MGFSFLTRSAGIQPFRYRGLYVESTWGTDLMTLADWRELIDTMAALELNSLAVGVYGCWGVQYDGRRSEFLLAPFPEHPRLETPKTMRWYSPAAASEQTVTYRPPMFEEDFLGEVVAYGQQQGIAVRPHFNGPGHSTLIPAVFPEISARDEQGRPTGFGYCLSHARTYELLFSLYDSLIARHLRPHGASWWHLGLDEVEASAGIDEADPTRVVEPWCHCQACAGRAKGQLLVDFAVRSIEHLVGQGIEHVTLWHDALARLNAYPAFKEAMAARGLLGHVAVQWWRYEEPALAVGERGLRSWVTPMAGYWPNLMHHEYGPNIRAMVTQGMAAGSEGVDAYGIYDAASFQSYACVAALGLNPGRDLATFEAGFSAWLFEGMAVPPAFAHAVRLFDSAYGPLGALLDAFLPSLWSGPAQRRVRYPQDQVAQLAADPLRLGQAVDAARTQAETLQHACREAAPRAADERRRRLLQEYAVEGHKLAGILAAFRHGATAWSQYRRARLGPTRMETVAALTRAQAALQTAAQAVTRVMAELETVKAPYLRPHLLRELTPLHRWCVQTHEQVRSLREQVEAGGLDDLPPL
ncbi:MAG TPA: family 20 glycosylhydrolase [Chloroflexota bacterium]|nr:family 20 glycosylhydrolase [Chloroflexota bacterium]